MNTHINCTEILPQNEIKAMRRKKLIHASDISLLSELEITGLNAKIAIEAYKHAIDSTIKNGKQFGLVFLAKTISNKIELQDKVFMTENGMI